MELPAVNGSELKVPPLEPARGNTQGPVGEEVQAPPLEVGNPEEFQRKYGSPGQPNLRVLAGGPPSDSPPTTCNGEPVVTVTDDNVKYNEATMSAKGTRAKVTFCGSAQKAQDILAGKPEYLPILKDLSKNPKDDPPVVSKTVSAKWEGDILVIKTWADKRSGLLITVAAKVTVTDGTYEPEKGRVKVPCKVVTLEGTKLPESDKTIHLSPYKVEYKIATMPDGKTVVSMNIQEHGTVIEHLSEKTKTDIGNVQATVKENLKLDLYNFFKNLAGVAK